MCVDLNVSMHDRQGKVAKCAPTYMCASGRMRKRERERSDVYATVIRTNGFRWVKVDIVDRPSVSRQLVLDLLRCHTPHIDVTVCRAAGNVLAIWRPCTPNQVLLKAVLSPISRMHAGGG